ncbi:MAG: 16S rRNA (adenine(1518)-N(6)/adenine(1519)-N(6))-dimethyltransferase RsmA [Candidatus Paceibacterota bacterium]
MNLLSEAKIKELLAQHNIRADKNQGQNFLTSKVALNKLLGTADLRKNDHVLEVGPGLGTITKELAEKVKQVTAVERDSRLVKILNQTCDLNNVEVINEDFLELDLSHFKNYKVVSSLPFNAATAIIRKILEESTPNLMAVTVQEEVAEKITTNPPEMTVVASAIQFYSNPEIAGSISKQEFFPEPKVNSSILKITDILPLNHKYRKENFNQAFFKVMKGGFAHSRKKLINSLELELSFNKNGLKQILKKSNIEPGRRAETLTNDEWIKLTKQFIKLSS